MKRAAGLFEELDATTSINAKVNALARYFAETDDSDKLWVIALLSARRPKRPVTSTQLRRWATDISGIPDWLFEASYHVVGDFAETVTHIAMLKEPMVKSLTDWVSYVEALKHLPDEEKADRVKAAWEGLEDMELFVFNKIITGGFRIGVSQRVMVKGLSKATGVEEDVLAHRLMGDWTPHTTTFKKLVLDDNSGDSDSRPYPFYLAYGIEGPEGTAAGAGLADLQALGKPEEWQAEHKWDGIRGQLIVRNQRHFVWSRGEELVTDKYPEFQALREVLPHGTVLDGEILAWKDAAPLPFAEMQKRIGRKSVGKKILTDVPVVFMAYDLLEFDGQDIRQRPISERRSLLERIVMDATHPSLLISDVLRFVTWEELVAHREAARTSAVEGIMLKRKSSTYEVGRKRGDWWKWKVDPMSIDAVLTFSMQGHGRRADLYTDHTFGLWQDGQLVTFAKAYSGLTDEEMKEVDRFVKKNTVERFGPVRQVTPQLVFEIAFEGISASSRHKSGVAVRFPRIARWRHDKKIEEANSLDDLKRLILRLSADHNAPTDHMAKKKPSTATPVDAWFASQGWASQAFQREVWAEMRAGKSGLLNAPTGTGKTYAVWGGVVNHAFKEDVIPGPTRNRAKAKAAIPAQGRNDSTPGLRAIWITPLRALASEIAESAQRMCDGVGLPWKVGTRTGDTSTKERAAQKKMLPHLLVTTPESLHVMLSTKGAADLFKQLDWFVADEWHELLGSKRGVQVELALSRLRALRPAMRTWGISATIGNIEEAMEVLQGVQASRPKTQASTSKAAAPAPEAVLVRSNIKKHIEVRTIIPKKVENYPWSGHLGLRLAKSLLPIIEKSTSTLIFTNTRGQAEIWYHHLLDIAPDLAGTIALHHGSLNRSLREWVEKALDAGKLKAVVCTSSLDLGVDFRPVESVVQIGGPKGVARFAQRAGRSGHRPDATPRIWFLPTHALELVEAAALRDAVNTGNVEARQPMVRSFDVLAQYLVTLAVGDGFDPRTLLDEVRGTFCYRSISDEEWAWLITFITTGGQSLKAYDEFRKCVFDADGLVRVEDRRIAQRHRLSIGTIVSESSLAVKYMSGGHIGTIEEYFINQMRPGDVFWFAGRSLEFVRVKDLTAFVLKSKATKGKIPSWQGGRMPLSSYMAKVLRAQFDRSPSTEKGADPELNAVQPLLNHQRETSIVPGENELLIERFESKEGHHVVVYPFEGRFIHEAMGSLLAFRMSLLKPITFSIAMNDYGFELLSDQPIPIEEAIDNDLFSEAHLLDDLQRSLNATEMARRKFRDIATIAGLVFQGFPGRPMKERHVRGNSSLFFEVFTDHEPDHLLLRQAYDEAFNLQMELPRLHAVLQRIAKQRIVLKDPGEFTPFAFPIIVDRLREKLTSEQLEDRIRKMTERLEKA